MAPTLQNGVELKAILAQATEKGCFRMMFNIGPMGDGTIDPREATSCRGLRLEGPLVEALEGPLVEAFG